MAKTPTRPQGHCHTDEAWAEFERQYKDQPRTFAHVSDFQVANNVFMASRDDLDLIVHQTAAKERIRWLSLRLAESLGALKHLNDVAEYGGDASEEADRILKHHGIG